MGFDFLNQEIKDDVLCSLYSFICETLMCHGGIGEGKGFYTKLLLNLNSFHIYLAQGSLQNNDHLTFFLVSQKKNILLVLHLSITKLMFSLSMLL